MDVESKREGEKKTVDRMIRIYCHGVHGTTAPIAPSPSPIQPVMISNTFLICIFFLQSLLFSDCFYNMPDCLYRIYK